MRDTNARPPLTKDDLEHLKWARELEALLVHPGWKIYTQIIKEHREVKRKEAEDVVRNMDEALFQNAAKGALKAFALCLDIPQGIINVAKDIRALRGTGEEE